MPEPSYRERAEHQMVDAVEVAVSVLSPRESRGVLGLPIHKTDLQPVWISIENPTRDGLVVVLPAIDADYFSPSEAVYLSRYRYRRWLNRDAQTRFLGKSLPVLVPPRMSISGFVYSNQILGYRYVHVLIIGEGSRRDYRFLIRVPGHRMDFDQNRLLQRVAEREAEDVSLAELRSRVAEMPHTTANRRGTGMGDPLNLVFLSPPNGRVIEPMLRTGWVLTEANNLGSIGRTVRAFLTGGQYRHSPVSPLYAFGRPQDVALQKIRWSIRERNHMRLWLTPYRCKGRQVVLGQISRDIGVRLTRRTRILTTHRIDPDVDHARNAHILELVQANCLESSGWSRMFDSVRPDAPRSNLTGDPWWSDGMRLVAVLTNGEVPPESVGRVGWDERSGWF